MDRICIPSSLRYVVIATALALTPSSYSIIPAQAENGSESSGATTLTSKHNVKLIIDRERSANQTTLLLKIMVPEDAKVESFALSDPARIVVDFVGVKIKTSENVVPPKNGVVKMIRLGAHADKLRVVLDLATATAPQYEWRGGARQATLRILESGESLPSASAAPPPPAQQPPSAPPPTEAPKAAPTAPATVAPTTRPTIAPTSAPTLTPTRQPTAAPTTRSTDTPTAAPTSTFTNAPTSLPTKPAAIQPEPKLPDMTEKELEEALDKEVARATEALERGEKLPENLEFEGEDLVDVPAEEPEDVDLSEEKEPEAPKKEAAADRSLNIVTKDLPTGATNPAPTNTDSVTGLRANSVPAPPVTDFTVQSAEFSFLEPDHKESFKVLLSRPGAQAQMSKVDPTTYKVVISKCGLANLGLALPQYPPSDYKGILAVTPKVEGDTVEITAQVEPGVSLTTLVRDREVWIKRQ